MAVGQGVLRKDAEGKITGDVKFLDDLSFPNMLYGKIVMSGVSYARVQHIDTSSIPDDVTCILGKDIPGENRIGIIRDDQPFLANSTVRYAYEPVALLAADNLELLEEAERQLSIQYQEKKGVFHYEDALKKDAVQIHSHGNVALKFKLRKGDANEALKSCPHTVKHHFSTHYQEQLYLEPNGAIAVPEPFGVTIYGTMQCPFYVRKAVARVLGYPLAKVRVVQTATGGAFGGKEDVPNEICSAAAVLALKTGKPVKVVYERSEDICRTSKRHPFHMHYEYGFDDEGIILAAKAEICSDIGAYITLSPAVLFRGFCHALGPYNIENAYVDMFGVYTNNQPVGAFRGFGTPQVVFAHEAMMDEIARVTGLDPWEVRNRNLLHLGDRTITNQKLNNSVGLQETMDAVKPHYDELKKQVDAFNQKNEYKKQGLGLSTIYYGNGLGVAGKALDAAGSMVQVNQDGSAFVSVGCTEMGQGALTVLSQIAAETLGFQYDKVFPNFSVDTAMVQDSGPTVASRTTVMSGNAIMDACLKINQRIRSLALSLLNKQNDDPAVLEELILKEGRFYLNGTLCEEVSLKEVLNQCFIEHVQMTEAGWYKVPDTEIDPDTGLGSTYYVFCFATQLAHIEIDKLTGEISILKIVSAHDVGKCINPVTLRGQIIGGVVQGMGYAVFENLVSKNGKFTNPSMMDYIIPSIQDIPEIVPIVIEAASPDGPYGAKGIGEPSLIPAGASYSNALAHGLGKRLFSLPLLPEKIKKLIDEDRV